MATLRANHRTQLTLGAEVLLLAAQQLRECFAWLRTSDPAGAPLRETNVV